MSGVLVLVVVVTAGFLAILVAQRTRADPVGTSKVEAPQGAGHHATATAWLMTGPLPARHHAGDMLHHGPSDRLVRALAMRRAGRDRTGFDDALAAVTAEGDEVARAYLAGRMAAAQRAVARRMYHGPAGAFDVWYLFVALPRHGRRGLRNAAMRHIVEVCA